MAPPAVAAAMAEYDALLDAHLASTAEALRRRPGGSGAMALLRPRILARATYEHVRARTALVHAAVEACVDRLLDDDAVRRDLFRLRPEVDARVVEEGRLGRRTPVSRFDGMLGRELTFLEFNGSSGGILKSARLAALFRDLPITRAFAERFRFRDFDLGALLYGSICAVARAHGHDGPPRFGMIGARMMAADRTGEAALFRAEMAARGATVTVGDSHELSYDGTLRLHGEPVTCIVSYEPRPSHAPLVARAMREGAAWSLLGVRDELANSKVIPALLSDPERSLIPDELAESARRHVPWTRLLRAGPTDYEGERVDLLPFVAARRERFVLKPAHSGSGHGILLGWEVPGARWRAAVEWASRLPFVVQERVELERERYPVLAGDRYGSEELCTDLGPFIWADGAVEGCFVRATRTGMMNLSAGGAATTALWVLDE
jgi:hypothetical protein